MSKSLCGTYGYTKTALRFGIQIMTARVISFPQSVIVKGPNLSYSAVPLAVKLGGWTNELLSNQHTKHG